MTVLFQQKNPRRCAKNDSHNTGNKGNLLSKIGDSLKISVPAAKNKYSHLRKDFNEKPL